MDSVSEIKLRRTEGFGPQPKLQLDKYTSKAHRQGLYLINDTVWTNSASDAYVQTIWTPTEVVKTVILHIWS